MLGTRSTPLAIASGRSRAARSSAKAATTAVATSSPGAVSALCAAASIGDRDQRGLELGFWRGQHLRDERCRIRRGTGEERHERHLLGHASFVTTTARECDRAAVDRRGDVGARPARTALDLARSRARRVAIAITSSRSKTPASASAHAVAATVTAALDPRPSLCAVAVVERGRVDCDLEGRTRRMHRPRRACSRSLARPPGETASAAHGIAPGDRAAIDRETSAGEPPSTAYSPVKISFPGAVAITSAKDNRHLPKQTSGRAVPSARCRGASCTVEMGCASGRDRRSRAADALIVTAVTPSMSLHAHRDRRRVFAVVSTLTCGPASIVAHAAIPHARRPRTSCEDRDRRRLPVDDAGARGHRACMHRERVRFGDACRALRGHLRERGHRGLEIPRHELEPGR